MPDILDAVAQHRQPFDTHSERETAVFLGVDTAAAEYIGVGHAGPQYLQPAGVFTSPASGALAHAAFDSHFHAGLDEREVIDAEAVFSILAEVTSCELVKDSLEVGHGNAFVHRYAVDMVENIEVCGIGRLIAVALAHLDGSYRRFIFLQGARGYGCRVGA